jgi:hypothetical protein
MITFRSREHERYNELHKEITEMKKNATKREQERKEMADVVEQEGLELVKGICFFLLVHIYEKELTLFPGLFKKVDR